MLSKRLILSWILVLALACMAVKLLPVVCSQILSAIRNSLTGEYLSGKKSPLPSCKTPLLLNPEKMLVLEGASGNNLQNVTLEIPLGLLTCITGVSGSGKSTLVNHTLYPILAEQLNGASTLKPAAYESIRGLEHVDKCIDIDQSPIGRTPRSNPCNLHRHVYAIRDLFAGTQEARSRGYHARDDSVSMSSGGRCEACEGDGVTQSRNAFSARCVCVL
jgi:excinuclease ABC subunit A